jgi:hypothetical protein
MSKKTYALCKIQHIVQSMRPAVYRLWRAEGRFNHFFKIGRGSGGRDGAVRFFLSGIFLALFSKKRDAAFAGGLSWREADFIRFCPDRKQSVCESHVGREDRDGAQFTDAE